MLTTIFHTLELGWKAVTQLLPGQHGGVLVKISGKTLPLTNKKYLFFNQQTENDNIYYHIKGTRCLGSDELVYEKRL